MINTITVNEVEFAYQIYGSGEPLVLISGYSRDHSAWDVMVPVLSKYYQVLVFDNQGAGRTKDQGQRLTAELMADNTWALINALGLKNPTVVGISMGGAIAQAMACSRGNDMKKLILINSAAFWGVRAKKMLQGVVRLYQENMSLDVIVDVCLPWLFGVGFLSNAAYIEQYRQSVCARSSTMSLLGLQRQAHVIMSFNSGGQLSLINVPTAVIISEEDLMMPPEDSKKMAAAIAGSVVKTIPGGHSSQIEQPKALLEALNSALIEVIHE